MARQQEPEHELDPLLRQVLRNSSAEVTGACLDGETLAAWADGSLRHAEMVMIEAHAAECVRCRRMLAAFVSSGEETLARGDARAPIDVPFWRRWRLQWLVPMAATATALAVYIATPEPPASPGPNTFDANELARQQSELPSRQLPMPVPSATGLAASAESATASATAPLDIGETATRMMAKERSEPQPAPAPSASLDTRANASSSGNFAPQPDATAETSRNARAEAKAAMPASPRDAATSLDAPPSVAPIPPSQPSPALEESVADTARARVQPAAPPVESDRADAANQWRVRVGRVEQSGDGRAWRATALPPGVDYRQVVALGTAGRRVVWVVGRGGLVLVSADGAVFRLTTSPTTQDLVSVEVRDARAATVQAADGRRFTTNDGGATWASR